MEAKLIEIPAQTIDDYGDIVKLRDAFAPTERTYQRFQKQLKELCVSADPNKEYVVKGKRYTLRISACSYQNAVDIPKAKRKLGVEKFLKCCSVTLTSLANYLSKPEIDTLTIQIQTANRSFNPIPIAAHETRSA